MTNEVEKRWAEGKWDMQEGGAGAERQEVQVKHGKQAWKVHGSPAVEQQVSADNTKNSPQVIDG